MLQRNDGAEPAVLPTLGITVEPGGTIEHDEALAGFVEVARINVDEPKTSRRKSAAEDVASS